MTTTGTQTRQRISEATAVVLENDLAGDVDDLVRTIGFRRFQPDNTLEKRVLLHEAVRIHLLTGDRAAATRVVAQGVDDDVLASELMESVSKSAEFDALAVKARELVLQRNPLFPSEELSEVVGRRALQHVVGVMERSDPSRPLDIATGKDVTVCFIPGSSKTDDYRDTATTSWKEKSDSISIYPDATFVDFLKVVGMSKADWLAAVERNTTMSSAAKMGTLLEVRAKTWAELPEWETMGSLDLEDDDLVAAVDSCPFGFTPMIAFTMQAEELLDMDFSEILEVTGGIIGLHSFTTGSGDPLRFEGTLRFTPAVGDIHLADDQPLGLIASYGFLKSAFVSRVTRTRGGLATGASIVPSKAIAH